MSNSRNHVAPRNLFGTPSGNPGPGHLVIRASAGSGKTYQLAGRYIDALCRSSPDQILATTFTRKAAGEILGRVLGRLANASLDPAAAAKLAKEIGEPGMSQAHFSHQLKRLCRSLHRVAISTIDSFFNRMAMSFRHELNIPAGTRLLDEYHPLIVQARRRAIEAMLADAEPAVMLDLLRRLHHDTLQRSVTRAIESIVRDLHGTYREAPQKEMWNRVPIRKEATPELLEIAIEGLEGIRVVNASDKVWQRAIDNAILAARQRRWEDFCTKGIGKSILEEQELFSRKEIPEEVIAVYWPLLQHAVNTMLNAVTRSTSATYELIKRYDTQISLLLRQQRLMTFSDVPDKLVADLPKLSEEDRNEIYFRLDARVQHLLLDEFQDTSPRQWEVLRPFASEIVSHGDGSRSFFCVGDMKQAIYGWRGGVAELFDQIEDDLQLGPESIRTLSVSYRSAQVVLDSVNQVFSSLDQYDGFDPKTVHVAQAWREGFEQHVAAKLELKGYVELASTEEAEDDENEETYLEDEEDPQEQVLERRPTRGHLPYVARRIKAIHERSPGKSIGVLVGTNKKALAVLDLLRHLGVRASGEGGNPVTDDAAVNAVLAAFTLADHPGDSAAAFHVQNSPLGPIVGVRSMAREHLRDVALKIRSRLAIDGYARVIADWASDPRVVAACNDRNRTRLGHLVGLAEEHDVQPTLRPIDFVRFVEMSMVEEPGNVPVRVMTIHKSKGLEFDVVVLPELDRRMGDVSKQTAWIRRDSPTGPIEGVYRATSEFVRKQAHEMETAHRQTADRKLQDELCQLYVAMTRARHALYMFVKPRGVTKSGDAKAVPFSFAGILRSRLGRGEGIGEKQRLHAHGDAAWAGSDVPENSAPSDAGGPASRTEEAALVTRFVVSPGGRAPGRSMQVKSPSSLEAGGKVKVNDLLLLKPTQARSRGSVVHAWFEAIEFIDDNWSAPEADELDRLAKRASPESTASELAVWRAAFAAMTSNSVVRLALARPAMAAGESVGLWREREFVAKVGDELLRGVFDRVVIVYGPDARAQSARLIDFKTDSVTNLNLDQTVRTYRPQIDAYCKALSTMLGLTADRIRPMLLFVGAGLAVEVGGRT